MFSVRRKPLGLPAPTSMPSRTDQVAGAPLTFTQPVKSLPLNRSIKRPDDLGSSAKGQPANKRTATSGREAAKPFRVNRDMEHLAWGYLVRSCLGAAWESR